MAKKQPAPQGFGDKVRKVVQLVVADKEASERSSKALAGIKEFTSAEEDKKEAMEEFNGVQERWEKTHGLNKKAMKVLVSLSKMDDAKRADFLRTFLPGLEAVLPDQMDMFADNNGGEDSKTPSENQTPSPPASPTVQ